MVGLDLFRAIPTIFQTKQFDRSLEKLPQDIQKQWERAKNKLQQTTAIGALDFKLWEKRQNISVYSVRLNRGYRAHLEYDYTAKNWQATEIGTHKHMGHG
jgi:mRNA-degrading endonuclease RelE of RelBE toxin-antitoxin system